MSGTEKFVEQYGNMSFEEHPFCDGDAIAFCEIVYMPFYDSISISFDDEPMNFAQVAQKVFASRGYKHYSPGLMINKVISERLVQMSEKPRYKDMKVGPIKRVYSVNPAIQFTVMTFILPDGTAVVTFEGTDDTIAGWKEDLDILIHRGTPAYKYALEYLEKIAQKFSGDIIILGHSKGGNEALYCALKCSKDIRSRIKLVYNNDGPGYYSSSIFRTGSYDELGDRYKHFVPSSSFIGMLMAHDYDYKAVKSSKRLGPVQHDMATWYIEDGNLVTVEDVDKLAKITDVFFSKIATKTLDGYTEVVDKVMTDIISGTGQETLTQLSKNIGTSFKGAINVWKNIEPETKKKFKDAFKGSGKMLRDSIDSVRTNINVETAKNYFNEVKELINV